MLPEYVTLGVVSCCSGFVYRQTGFGAALTLMTAWFELKGTGALNASQDLVAIQECVTAMELYLGAPLLAYYYSRIDVRFAACVAMSGVVGGAIGTELLLKFARNTWIQRGIGLSMLLCLAVQTLHKRSEQSTLYEKAGVRPVVTNTLFFGVAGMFGGFLGTPGPPLIVYTLLYNIERHEVIMYNAVLYVAFNSYKLLAFAARRDDGLRMAPVYVGVLIGSTIGAGLGQASMRLVTQDVFLELLQGLLVCFIALSLTTETSVEGYGRMAILLIPPCMLWRRRRGLYASCCRSERGWRRDDDSDGTGRERLAPERSSTGDEEGGGVGCVSEDEIFAAGTRRRDALNRAFGSSIAAGHH